VFFNRVRGRDKRKACHLAGNRGEGIKKACSSVAIRGRDNIKACSSDGNGNDLEEMCVLQ